jgi:hypothetical protein
MFSYYRKLVKTTIKADKLAWLTYIDENLKPRTKHFRKYISKFKENDQAVTQLELEAKIITEPQSIADHFSSVFDSSCRQKAKCAISHLRSTKPVGPDEIPNFIIKGCSDIFIHLLHLILNLNISTGKFPSLWKQAAAVPIFKKDNRTLVVNYRPTSILNNFSKIFESIIYDHLFFHLKFKLHSNQHGFLKYKSTATNLITCLNDVTPSVCSQGQFDSVHFDLSQAFDKVPHALLLNKLNQNGLSSAYVK